MEWNGMEWNGNGRPMTLNLAVAAPLTDGNLDMSFN